jgi:hypothetical protein
MTLFNKESDAEEDENLPKKPGLTFKGIEQRKTLTKDLIESFLKDAP